MATTTLLTTLQTQETQARNKIPILVKQAFKKPNYPSVHFTNISIVFGTDVKKRLLNAES